MQHIPNIPQILQRGVEYSVAIANLANFNPISFDIYNRCCYKYFDDEDVMYRKFSLPPTLATKIRNTYNSLNTDNSNIAILFSKLNIIAATDEHENNNINDNGSSDSNTAILYIHPDNIDMFMQICDLFHSFINYYNNGSDLAYIPSNILGQIKTCIDNVAMYIILDPSDSIYNSMDDMDFEMLILINIAIKYLDMICCNFNYCDLTEQHKIYTIQLAHNFIILQFILCFLAQLLNDQY